MRRMVKGSMSHGNYAQSRQLPLMGLSHSNNEPCRACEAQSNADKVKDKQECLNGLRILDLVVNVRVEVERKPCKKETSDRVGVDVDYVECQRSFQVAESSY
jgi:hypothetical protein